MLTHDPDPEVLAHHLPLWPAVLPSHREVVAAHTVHTLLVSAERDLRGAAQILPTLAECDGPAGPAMALALAYGLASKDQQDRVAATDALLHMIATDGLDPVTIGHTITTVLHDSQIKLPRIVTALTQAANAGAATAIGHIALAALATLLTASKPPRGTPDLLELATHLTPAYPPNTPPIDSLAQLAARTGSSRLITEARRLHQALTR
jgi:hypothetical protein